MLEGPCALVHTFAVALTQHETIVLTARREITILIETNGFSEAVKTMGWNQKRRKRMHGYVTIAIELVRVSEQQC